MHRILCFIALLVIAAYLVALRSDWFTEAARSPVGRNPLYSEPLDLRKPQTFTWTVPKDRWSYRSGKAQLSLALNVFLMREMPQDRSQVELRIQVSAFGVRPDGSREDRLVRDSYYCTDEPFSNKGRSLWETWGYGRVGYGLGAVPVKQDEDTEIDIHVTTPDPLLALGNPRLKLVGEHDYAGLPWQWFFLLCLRDGGLAVSLILLASLFLLAWGVGRKRVVKM
jgi:hypothetical protein